MTDRKGQAGLSETQLQAFREKGFLVIDQLLDDADIVPIEQEYEAHLEEVARLLLARGDISETYPNLGFRDRFTRLLADYPDLHNFLNISLPLENGTVNEATYHGHFGPAIHGLLRNEKLLDVVESVIGSEIEASPVQQLRMKPPEAHLSGSNTEHSNVGRTTWHQDVVALFEDADDTDQLTVWVAITDAAIENGCLVSIPGSHRRGAVAHCTGKELAREPNVPQVLVDGFEEAPLPVKRGGAVLFHKLNIHRAMPNVSNQLRWSFDLRFHPIGQKSGRPAFPGLVVRSRENPSREERDPARWARTWEDARQRILAGQHQGKVFAADRFSDSPVC
ncbi:phytanoyl-CoA dioxygenase family protein [Coralliovum pocilloporae]|uniref:phytanoyl-CoA dioxygenase family protein n=1 Tax=Coralliovum pocilloporae TaxID=3066369 RepID=UPI003306DC9F